jgi:hypothetical protein
MANKDRPARMQKKPKKDAKLKSITTHDESPAVAVEVVKRKRKERLPDEE